MGKTIRFGDLVRNSGVVACMAIAALLIAALVFAPSRPPLAVQVMGFEPAGIFDDTGEMWVVTARVYNPGDRRDGPIYIKAQKSESRVENHWSRPQEAAGSSSLSLYGSLGHEVLFLAPPKTDRCRISVQWTGAHLTSGRLWWLAERMTILPRVRAMLWKWGRGHFPTYAPNSHWREFNVEVPLPARIGQPAQ